MTGIAIYMEGGGEGGANRAALRTGMNRFLKELRQAAGRKRLRWKIVACGSRNDALRGFKNAVHQAPDWLSFLLVDAEASVRHLPRAHLEALDNWDLSFVTEDWVHLMVQTMETWIVADPECLATYYGQRFRPNRLPSRPDLEEEPKARVAARLRDATANTTKGVYHKIHHASDLLAAIDPDAVRHRCRHCDRLFNKLAGLIEAA